ncbi:hypothetical protein LNV08_11860 [Paucibacter sp. TC2R-5]|uniref:hypothetical protein n=1 Tax=Paucibacter sp. TC2R-5 TaxID=2893555 RepID=UPI0021E3EABC|nr:hypothetical protein [Paucibacter sp. TC2R-5]MCV2359665.1 hypothetical protein [Paucibacter sp. TC2R-5]
MKNHVLKSPSEARAWFTAQGLSIAEWCRQHQVGASLTRQILEGKKPCHRGQSHQIAVLLGIKAGVINRPLEAARQKGPRQPAKALKIAAGHHTSADSISGADAGGAV